MYAGINTGKADVREYQQHGKQKQDTGQGNQMSEICIHKGHRQCVGYLYI